MKCLELPHRTADYLCPINGLCDIYEWVTGCRIPDGLLFFARTGFTMVSQARAVPPRMVFLSNGKIGAQQMAFWQPFMGYTMKAAEGRSLKRTLADVTSLIDQGVPVILFGLDMYYLPYLKFYHSVHIPGHVVLMVGYDDDRVYVHDNSREGVQTVPLEDLCEAWKADYTGISMHHAYFGIDLSHPNRDVSGILRAGLAANAHTFLHAPVSFIGQRGWERFIGEFAGWHRTFDAVTMRAIYEHLATFTASTLPELPPALSGLESGIDNPHRGSRDKLARALEANLDALGVPGWADAAAAFRESGELIESITNELIQDVLANSFANPERYLALFRQVVSAEVRAHRYLV